MVTNKESWFMRTDWPWKAICVFRGRDRCGRDTSNMNEYFIDVNCRYILFRGEYEQIIGTQRVYNLWVVIKYTQIKLAIVQTAVRFVIIVGKCVFKYYIVHLEVQYTYIQNNRWKMCIQILYCTSGGAIYIYTDYCTTGSTEQIVNMLMK